MAASWRTFKGETRPVNMTADVDLDEIYYAREYIPKDWRSATAPYGGESENFISNFKKKPSKRVNPYEWRHKGIAIHQFMMELKALLPDDDVIIIPVPCSKERTHPEYDPRMQDTLNLLKVERPHIIIVEPIIRAQSLESLHFGHERNIQEIYDSFEWIDGLISEDTKHVFLLDDVLTTGATFEACRKLINENLPRVKVGGIFWAKTIWPGENLF
jgi:predicted amidophosphoribosyltransferase